MAKILVVGSINMDLVVRVPHSPKPGETVLGGDFETFPGGKGANQAVAAARMGGEVTMVGRVGNDDFGNTLIQGLVEDKIKTTHVIKDSKARTGVAMISVAADGENMIVVASGANAKVSVEDVGNTRSLMRETDLLLVQLECPLETVIAAIELAKAYGVPVVLNPAPAQPLPKSLLRNVDYLTPNQNELLILTGEAKLNDGIGKIKKWGLRNLIITLGANGARVISDGIDQHLPAHEITAVDTTAAGDAFNGALAVALAEGKQLLEAVSYGMAAGALASTKRGAQPSLPTRDAVENLLASQNRA
ncbi:MAG: ribokinase [Brevefilum sp.]|nr:ribokinase [Brevefilum sp.]MDT8382317.1 ribokinase [Brevefilum sp.]MDW7755007.1 ribokinase [Brevefilum sp.]